MYVHTLDVSAHATYLLPSCWIFSLVTIRSLAHRISQSQLTFAGTISVTLHWSRQFCSTYWTPEFCPRGTVRRCCCPSLRQSVNVSWRRSWQPTSVFLPGESHGQSSLADYSPWDCKETRLKRLSTAQDFYL